MRVTLATAAAALLALAARSPVAADDAGSDGVPLPRLSPRSDVDGDCASRFIPPADETLGALTFEGGFELTATRRDLGGLSGIEAVDQDTLLAVSDDGRLVTIELGENEDGAPLARCAVTRLRGLDGKPLALLSATRKPREAKREADAEGVVLIAPDRIAVSFERQHRIALFTLGEAPEQVGDPIDLAGVERISFNSGIEALALLPSGEIAAGAESLTVLGGHPVWRIAAPREGDAPKPPASEPSFVMGGAELGFSLVGLDATPTGGLVALERFYSPHLGARSRLSWLPPGTAESASGVVRPLELGRLNGANGMLRDNFEGVAAVAGEDGRTVLWLVSDDNFSEKQKTLLYSFSFDESAL